MLFTSPDNFKDIPYKIANIDGTNDVMQEVAKFIGDFEYKARVLVLGSCLNKELEDSMEIVSGIFQLKDTATTPIKNLVNGLEYTKPPQTNYIDFGFGFGYGFGFGFGYGFGYGCGCGCGSSTCDKRYWKGLNSETKYLYNFTEKTIKTSFFTPFIYYSYLLENRSITTGTGEQVIQAENSLSVLNLSKRIDAYNNFMFAVLGGKREMTSLYQFLEDNKADYPTWERNCNLKFKEKW